MVRITTVTAFIWALIPAVNAFCPAHLPVTRVSSSTARNVLLSEEQTDAILESAHDCAEGECNVDDVSGLIAELKEQQSEMSHRLEEIMNMVSHLQQLNGKEIRRKDEIRDYVKDLLRVFNPNTKGYATGFSGDIGDGPTTAYKALNPKPWKP